MTIPWACPAPEAAEAESIAAACITSQIAVAVGEPHLFPPRCPLVHLIGDEHNARGALQPSVAKATLTRDSQRRWDLARKARRGIRPEYLLIRAIQAR